MTDTYREMTQKRRQKIAANSARRRAINTKLGRCINHPIGTKAAPHGPRVGGHVRCQRCIDTHGRSR